MSNPRRISPDDVPRIFDAEQVRKLAQILRLPPEADLIKFGADVRQIALTYVREVGTPSLNEQRQEIEALHRLLAEYVTTADRAARKNAGSEAAARKLMDLGERLAIAVETMSPPVRKSLAARGANIDDQLGNLTNGRMRNLPAPGQLRDPFARDQAVKDLRTLIEFGGNWSKGRNRPTGHRSRTWKPLLHVPNAALGKPRQSAERFLIISLQIDVSKAMGKQVSFTADARKPGPFARFAAEVLRLVGAAGSANAVGMAVEIINAVNRERESLKARNLHHAFDLWGEDITVFDSTFVNFVRSIFHDALLPVHR